MDIKTDTGAFLLTYLNAIWRRKWVVASVCWGVCLIGWVAVFELPDSYQSDARVYLDVNSMLTPLLRGLAIDADPLRQLDFMQRTLLSRPNLEQIIHLSDLDSKTKTPTDKDALLLDLTQRIKVSLQGQNLFNISFADPDPVLDDAPAGRRHQGDLRAPPRSRRHPRSPNPSRSQRRGTRASSGPPRRT